MKSWLFVCCALWGSSCGSGAEQGPIQPDDGPVLEERAGAVYVSNETPYPLQVVFLNGVATEDIYLVRTAVAVAERAMVSGGELPAGHLAEFDFALEVPVQEGPRVRRKASVRIAGEQRLRAHLQEAGEPFSLAIETAP